MPVAIKVFQPLRPTKEQVIRDIFQRELKVLNDVKDFTHVVRLIDWGTTSEWDGIEKPYAALEWVDGDLRDLLDEKPCEGWDDLAPMVIQILEGLSSIHQAGHAHRDIKPENVLVAQDGTLKIADFGISKAQTRMSQGVTFSGHGTVPYMPPEDYDGNFRLSRDVYAVAATVVVALGARVPASRDDLLAALDSLDLVPTVHAFWSRCLSSDPAERPASAEVALNQLRTIQKERAAHWVGQVDIYLSIAPPASDSVAARMSIDNADTGDFIVEDVGDKPTFARAERQTEALNGRDANDLYMYGNSFRYRLRPDEKQPVFIVIGAAKLPPSTLQTRSEEAWSGVVRIRRVSPLDLMQARADLTKLYEHVDEHERLAAERRTPARDRVTLRTWRQVLEFKRQVEANRGLPLRYRSFRLEGRRVIFDLMAEAGQDVIGQKRLVRGGRMRVLAGEVEDLAGNALSLFVETGTASNLPSSGQLEFDAEASKMAIARQVDAVDAVRFGRSVRTDLIDLLLHPESNRPPISVEIDRYYSSDLDVPKKAAIRSALGSSDIVLVEGPPGTGKTTFIAELVAQFLDRRPDARVLLSSQTHVALDNALDRLRQLRPELELVRLGPTAKIATEVEELRLEKRMEAWRDQIVVACRNFLGDFARQLGIMMPDTTTLDLAAELRQLTNALRDLRSTISVRQAERTALGAQADELQRHASTV